MARMFNNRVGRVLDVDPKDTDVDCDRAKADRHRNTNHRRAGPVWHVVVYKRFSKGQHIDIAGCEDQAVFGNRLDG